VLNLFFAEPEADRWFPFDRYPRRALRRVVRGPRNPGGMERYYLNLLDGLRRAGVPFRSNCGSYARSHPEEVVGIVGKGHLLRSAAWRNPVVFGPAVFSHPLEDPIALRSAQLKKVLVSCEWMKRMYEGAVDLPVEVWPSGVDTYTWRPLPEVPKDLDVLVYDKVRWERERVESEILEPIYAQLASRGLKVETIRYGSYREEQFRDLLGRARAMVFLVEHETQGFAYLQALACDIPLLAWDAGGFWRDPEFYPDRVRFEGVTSVPYWDSRCGIKFAGSGDLARALDEFLAGAASGRFSPREYVLENLPLEGQAIAYRAVLESVR
jgi:hypothetical protein